MIRYKMDVLKALAAAGWTQAKIRKYGIIGGGTLDRLRSGRPVTFEALSTVCVLLDCQPGDVLESVLTTDEKAALFDLRRSEGI